LTVTPKPADIIEQKQFVLVLFRWNGTVIQRIKRVQDSQELMVVLQIKLNLTVTPKPADIITDKTICSGASFLGMVRVMQRIKRVQDLRS
jgi:hypothetical protein